MRSEAYEILRDAIIRGELAPGEAIKDAELGLQIGLSRTPVREALARLADAGLVEFKPGVYTRVSTLDRRDVEATLDVLRALDDLTVRTAVPRLEPEDLADMRRANERFAAAVERHTAGAASGREDARADDAVTDALRADDEFHAVLIRAADNPVLSRTIERWHPAIHRILYRKFSTLLGGHDTVDHHERLVDVCARGDADLAAELSSAHWARLGGLIGRLFDTGDLHTGVAA